MNKTTKTIALFSVLSLMTVGCEKEKQKLQILHRSKTC